MEPASDTVSNFVIFATPSFDFRVSLEFLRSSIETEWALQGRGIAHGHIQIGGDCYLAKVRNKLVTEFLTDYPTATDFFFLDDDIGWPAAKIVEFLDRPEPVLAGIYPLKSEDLNFPVELTVDAESGALIERDGLVQANAVPTGFLRIKRHVLETLAAQSTTFKESGVGGVVKEYWNIFEMGRADDGWWWGEDYCFCQKWRATGGEIWVDPSIAFTHRGNRAWKADLSHHLQAYRDRALALIAPKEAA